MPLQDTLTRQYVSKADVFADAFNYLIYAGKPVIQPNQLRDVDTTGFAIPYRADEQGKPESAQKYRDVLKTLAVKRDSHCTYLVLGIENQSNVHYAMPVRNMLYDALQYEKQVRDLAAAHRKHHDNGSGDEYLSGIRKDDRIVPVITLVINFGSRRWDGPLSLHEMLNDQPEELLPFIQDYKVFLIDPMAMEDDDFQHLQSSLHEVLAFLKYQKDQEQMQRLLQENERYRHLEREAAMVIQAMTNTNFPIDPNAEVIDVCEAIQGMMNEQLLRGMQQANQQTAIRLLRMGLTVEQAAEATQLPREEVLLLSKDSQLQ